MTISHCSVLICRRNLKIKNMTAKPPQSKSTCVGYTKKEPKNEGNSEGKEQKVTCQAYPTKKTTTMTDSGII